MLAYVPGYEAPTMTSTQTQIDRDPALTGEGARKMQTLYNTDQISIAWADDGHIEIRFQEDGEESHELLTVNPEQTGQAQLDEAADTLEGMGLDDLAARLRERRGYDYGHEFRIAA